MPEIRRLLLLLAGTAVVAGCGANASPRWRLTVLPAPTGWGNCWASLLDGRGDVVGECSKPGRTLPFVWRAGKVVAIDPAGRGSAEVAAVNDRGEVAGSWWTRLSYYAEPLDYHAFVWRNGRTTELGPGEAAGLTDRGDVAGAADGRAVLWRSGKRILVGPAGSYAAGIDDAGRVVFNTSTPSAKERPWRWDNGTVISLGGRGLRAWNVNRAGAVLGDCEYAADGSWPCKRGVFVWRDGARRFYSGIDTSKAMGFGMNDRGDVVGPGIREDAFHARLWRGGAPVDLGTLPGARQSAADGVDDRDEVIGVSGNLSNAAPEWQRAFVWQRGHMIELPAPRGARTTPVAIDNGRIAGTINDKGSSRAVVWTR